MVFFLEYLSLWDRSDIRSWRSLCAISSTILVCAVLPVPRRLEEQVEGSKPQRHPFGLRHLIIPLAHSWTANFIIIMIIIISVISLSCAAAIDFGGIAEGEKYGSGKFMQCNNGWTVETTAPNSLTIIILIMLQCCSMWSLSSSWGGSEILVTVENNGHVGVTEAKKMRWKLNSHINSQHIRLHQQHPLR